MLKWDLLKQLNIINDYVFFVVHVCLLSLSGGGKNDQGDSKWSRLNLLSMPWAGGTDFEQVQVLYNL